MRFQVRSGPEKKVIYFISTGDTCRSPMAAAYLARRLEEADIQGIDVRSAGVLTVTGLRASQEARQIMNSVEVDLEGHRSSQLSPEMIRRADLILGMTPYHVQRAIRISEIARKKAFLLQEYTRNDLKNIQIQDPMGCTLEVFKKRFAEIRAACDRLLTHSFIAGTSVKPIAAEVGPGTSARKPSAKAAKSAASPKGSAKASKKPRTKAASAASKKKIQSKTKKGAKKAASTARKSAKKPAKRAHAKSKTSKVKSQTKGASRRRV